MKKFILLTIWLQASVALSQVSYQTLDSLSTVISQFQTDAVSQPYFDADSSQFELSLANSNFQVLSHNRLAYHAQYRKYNDQELLYLTEGIDLAKATALTIPNFTKSFCTIRLSFPAGQLKTQVFKDGVLQKTITPDFIDFYSVFPRGANRKNLTGWVNYKTLLHLCHLMQVEKGLIENDYVKAINKQFDEFLEDNTFDLRIREKFISTYQGQTPLPLCFGEVEESLTNIRLTRSGVDRFADSVSKLFRYKPNLSPSEFLRYNTDAANADLVSITNSNLFSFPSTSYNRNLNYKKIKNFYIKGFNGYITNNNTRTVVSCGWFVEDEKLSHEQHKILFEAIKQKIKKSIHQNFVYTPEKKSGQVDRIVIQVPKQNSFEIEYYISYVLLDLGSSKNISIGFTTDKSLADW